MKNMKLNEPKPITKNDAAIILKDNASHWMYDFLGIHQSECKNHTYHLVKVGKKGSIFNGCNGSQKSENGIYTIIVTWDYIHGKNFSLDSRGLEKQFEFAM